MVSVNLCCSVFRWGGGRITYKNVFLVFNRTVEILATVLYLQVVHYSLKHNLLNGQVLKNHFADSTQNVSRLCTSTNCSQFLIEICTELIVSI